MRMLKAIASFGAVIWTVPAVGQINLSLNVQNAATGSNSVTVLPGAQVNYQVIGTLTPDAGQLGLGLYGFDLEFEGGALPKANPFPDSPSPSGPPATTTCTNVMRNFQKDLGITNPEGIVGTQIAGKLVQVGGAQNTIKNTADNAEFPIGTTITGVARGLSANGAQQMCGPATLITGTLTAPQAPGMYKLKASQVFANVIDAGQNGTEEFWATKAAGVGSLTDLTVTVMSLPTITFVSALPAKTAATNTAGVFSRTTRNEVRMDFTGNLPALPAGGVRIREMQAGGGFGGDLSASFTGTITDTPGGGVDTARLILKDNGSTLVHRTWYQVDNAGTYPGVGNFCLQFVVQAGDCNGNNAVNAADLTCINAKVPTLPANAALDANFTSDINAATGISAADLSAANAQIPSAPVARPAGHVPCP